MNPTRLSEYQFCPRVPRALTFALIFTAWLCDFETRRVTHLFQASRYLRLVKTAVLPSNGVCSAVPIDAPLEHQKLGVGDRMSERFCTVCIGNAKGKLDR